MRLPVNACGGLVALGLLSAAIGGCASASGGGAHTAVANDPVSATGPAADYPMVLGEPYSIDGTLFTPADTLNYDAVGFTQIDGGVGITAAHRTLPLPCYVEVTSLDTGKTILVRVERRGPMTGNGVVALSPAAASQLGLSDGGPVRVRRVNPVEAERAELRAGRAAPDRMETPRALVEVLRRKLPKAGFADLAATQTASSSGRSPSLTAHVADRALAMPVPAPNSASPPTPPVNASPSSVAGHFTIQAATFANRAGAEKVAAKLGGKVVPAGRYYRVRTGPFTTRGQADVALAKVRAAGYSDARVIISD